MKGSEVLLFTEKMMFGVTYYKWVLKEIGSSQLGAEAAPSSYIGESITSCGSYCSVHNEGIGYRWIVPGRFSGGNYILREPPKLFYISQGGIIGIIEAGGKLVT